MKYDLNFLLRTCVRVALIITGFAYVFWSIDIKDVMHVTQNYDIFMIIFVVVFSGLVYGILGLRIRDLSYKNISTMTGTKASILCHGVNNLLPTKLGEIAKILYLSKNEIISKSEATGIIFWERFLDLNMIMLIAILAASLLNHDLAILPLCMAVIFLWLVLMAFKKLPNMPNKIISIIPFNSAKKFLSDLYERVNDRISWPLIFRNSKTTVLIWFLYVLQVYFFLRFVSEFDFNIAQVIAVFMATSLAMLIPSTPGAIGVYEAFVVAVLLSFGVNKEEAAATAIVMHLIEHLPAALITIFMLHNFDDKFFTSLFPRKSEGAE